MVGKVCTVCRNGSYLNKNLSFFTYPGDPERRYHWLNAARRLDLVDKLSNDKTRANHRICEVHFDKKFVKQKTPLPHSKNKIRKYLTKDAFPTLHIDNPSSLVIPTSKSGQHVQAGYRKKDHKRVIAPSTSDAEFTDTESCTDVSEFCESVMTVSNSTLTFQPSRDTLNNVLRDALKRRKLHEVSITPTVVNTDGSLQESPFCERIKKVSKATQTVQQYTRKKIEETNITRKFKTLNGEPVRLNPIQCDLKLNNLEGIAKWAGDAGKTNNLNLLALNLYYSGSAYDLLKSMLNLPTIDIVKQYLIPKTTGLDSNLNNFKAKVKNMSAKERICCVVVGKVDLKANLYYDIKCDRIMGLHDVNGKQKTKLAEFAVVAIAQGIVENWVQPVACALLSNQQDGGEFLTWTYNVISGLMDIGLDVRAYVSDLRCDQRSNLNVTLEQPYFSINGENIFYVYDTSQLVEIVNCVLQSCYVYCNGNKLENNDFLNKLIDLCDILNAKSRYSVSRYKRSFSNKKYQTDFLKYMITLLQNLRIIRKSDGKDITVDVEFVNNFSLTIKSIMRLFEDLKSVGVKFLLDLTHQLSHNFYLNQFFNTINKYVTDGKCTGRQFNKCFVRSFVFNMLKKPVGIGKQYPEYSSEIENYSQELINQSRSGELSQNFNTPLKIDTTDYRESLPNKNTFTYLCKYLYMKCLQHHYCKILKNSCKEFESETKNRDDNANMDMKNRKMIPPDFNDFIMVLETKFRTILKSNIEITSVGQEMLEKMACCEFEMPCPCFPIVYLKTLFVRARIFYTIRQNRKMLKRPGEKLFKVFRLL